MPLPISAQHPDPQRTLTPALLAVMWMALYGFGTFFLNYSTLVTTGQQMGLTAVTAGMVLTIMMVAVVAVQPLVPSLNTRLGARYTFLIGLGLQAIGHILPLFTVYPFAALLTGSIIGGLGFGILVVIGTAVVPSTVAPDRLGRALGFYGATTASATAVGAPLGLWLVTVLSATHFRGLSFGLVLLALPAILMVPKRQITEHAGPHSPQQDHAQPVRELRLTGLLTVLFPTAFVLTVFGLVLAFGPAEDGGSPALYIAVMQGFVIVGRFLGSAALDRYPAVTIMAGGLLITLLGMVGTAVIAPGWGLVFAMGVLGFGTGTVQSSSLLLAFRQAGSPNRGSVAWNMTFDIGLGFAGLVGGVGFTYWGAQTTYLWCAAILFLTSVVFVWYFRRKRHAP